MTTVARNAPCPCGSGKKAKKCHAESVGMKDESAQWYLDHQTFLAGCVGFVSQKTGEDGWSLRNYREQGCPFGDVCTHHTDLGGRCASPNCGV